MKYLIGKSERTGHFNFVADLKPVSEETFYKDLNDSIIELGGNKKAVKEGLQKAMDYVKTGKSVTIEQKYFIIKKR